MERRSGVLLHITSLHGKENCGVMGEAAREFIDFLQVCGQKVWQILPTTPVDGSFSPYKCYSAFAGSPLLIDPEGLLADRLISKKEAEDYPKITDLSKANFADHAVRMDKLLRSAFKRSCKWGRQIEEFAQAHSEWLSDYAFFMALRENFGGASLWEWPEDIRCRKADSLEKYGALLWEEMEFHKFVQFVFFKQWQEMKKYANKNGVSIMGDIPIYVSDDSAEVWAKGELFFLDEKTKRPRMIAGVPPDYFSEEGQLWGNPVYNWSYIKSTGYKWWIERIKLCMELYDSVRIDHFRGFDEFWGVPAGSKNALAGQWFSGPGLEPFSAARQVLGELNIVAEDLGVITESVRNLVRESGFPGMRVLQFAFDPDEKSNHLPHYFKRHCVCYTGTHDNNTAAGWAESATPRELAFARQYMGGGDIARAFVRTAMTSVAKLAIVPMQDWLGLGSTARMNIPSLVSGQNWSFRIRREMLGFELAEEMRSLTAASGR